MLYTCVLDLKLTPDGKVKVLEMQQPYQSGTVGYEQAYNQCMHRDVIMPFYRNEFGVEVINMDKRSDDRKRNLGRGQFIESMGWDAGAHHYNYLAAAQQNPDFDPDDLKTYSGILSPMYFEYRYSAHAKEEQKPYVAVVNDNRVFHAITCSKAMQTHFLSPLLGEMAAQEEIVFNTTPAQMAEEIRKKITTDKVMVKLPEAARAEGVLLAETDRLEDFFGLLVDKGKILNLKDNIYLRLSEKGFRINPQQALFKRECRDMKLSDYFNHKAWRHAEWADQKKFVAQAIVDGKPVTYKDGKQYDPTMRAFLTVWGDKGELKCEVHGGYWKYPHKPVAEKSGALNMISASPTKKPGGQVSDEDMEIVREQLTQIFAPAIAKIHGMKLEDIIRDYMKKPDDKALDAIMDCVRLSSDLAFLNELSEQELTSFGEQLARENMKRGIGLWTSAGDSVMADRMMATWNVPSRERMKMLRKSYENYVDSNVDQLPTSHYIRVRKEMQKPGNRRLW